MNLLNAHRQAMKFLRSALLWVPCSAALAQPLPLDVLHWWTSSSEQLAVDQLKAHLLFNGMRWKDAAIPGGGGMAAVKVSAATAGGSLRSAMSGGAVSTVKARVAGRPALPTPSVAATEKV